MMKAHRSIRGPGSGPFVTRLDILAACLLVPLDTAAISSFSSFSCTSSTIPLLDKEVLDGRDADGDVDDPVGRSGCRN
jgi:hypothetical protein